MHCICRLFFMAENTVPREAVMAAFVRFVAPAIPHESTLSNATKRESNSHSAPILLTFNGIELLRQAGLSPLSAPTHQAKDFHDDDNANDLWHRQLRHDPQDTKVA